jgi:hypothetical protein
LSSFFCAQTPSRRHGNDGVFVALVIDRLDKRSVCRLGFARAARKLRRSMNGGNIGLRSIPIFVRCTSQCGVLLSALCAMWFSKKAQIGMLRGISLKISLAVFQGICDLVKPRQKI